MKFILIPIWCILVIVWTGIVEGLFYLFINFVGILWNFGLSPVMKWSDIHRAEDPWDNKWGGYSYEDKTIKDTIIRRIKDVF